jgi:thiol-disulfide isomerase/thioredoxin
VLAALLTSACGESTSDSSSGSTRDAPSSESTIASEGSAPAPDPVELAAWQKLEITDADGESFTLADFVGRPVFVENFATWCSNCRKQLGDTQTAAQTAGDGAVFVALSVETELDAADMADYARDNGFSDIRFAVMSPDLLGAMFDAYGNSSLNPPSTPKVAIAADGAAGELVTGYESSQEILSSLGLA